MFKIGLIVKIGDHSSFFFFCPFQVSVCSLSVYPIPLLQKNEEKKRKKTSFCSPLEISLSESIKKN